MSNSPRTHRTDVLLRAFFRSHPTRTTLTLLCLLLAGVAEAIGVSSLLPLVGLTANRPPSEPPSALEAATLSVLERLGLEPSLELLLATLVLGMTVKAALVMAANRQVGYTVARVATELRLELIRALLRTRWSYYVREPLGAFANSVASEARRASDAYLYAVSIFALLIQSLVYATVAFFVSWQAAAAALVGGMLVVLALHRLVRASRRAGARQTRLSKSLLGRLIDVLQAIKALKAMGRETLVGPLLEAETRRLNRALRKEVLSKEARQALQEPMLVVFLAGGLYAAVRVWSLPPASVMVLALLSARVVTSLGRVQKELQSLVVRESAYWSIRELIDRASEEREASCGREVVEPWREIRLRDVGFAYDELWVVRHASLTVPAERLTVIIGPSGAGKTTIADLVIGLHEPIEGEILVDGVSLRRMDPRRWRTRIGYVPQETLLLHESIRVNVTLGDPGLGDADVEEALRAAEALDFVAALPEGMSTMVGERGLRLSGGQRQRIALARALVHKPALLILDEATTALDPATEAGICTTLARLRAHVAILAICHHGPLVELADQVYLVRGGTVAPASTEDVHASREQPPTPARGAGRDGSASRPDLRRTAEHEAG